MKQNKKIAITHYISIRFSAIIFIMAAIMILFISYFSNKTIYFYIRRQIRKETHYDFLNIDIRNGKDLDKMDGQLSDMKAAGFQYEILFMDASDKTLIKRYKETRRQHPMAVDGRVETGLKEERAKLAFLKKEADYIMDTSQLLVRELVQNMDEIFQQNREFKNMVVTVLSFGFKNGTRFQKWYLTVIHINQISLVCIPA